MPLTHFVAEARKNTPVLGTSVVEPVKQMEMPASNLRKEMAEISQVEKKALEKAEERPSWKNCQHLKSVGGKEMCTQYMSLCAKENCQKKFMETNFFDFKKYLKQGKTTK